jgi:hypothetical protein
MVVTQFSLGTVGRNWRPAQILSVLAVVGVLLSSPTAAHAFHTKKQRITDDSAYTLNRRDWRLGIWKTQIAMGNRVTLGTLIWPWFFKVANLQGKWMFYHQDPWAFAVHMGVFRLDTASFEKIDSNTTHAVITAAPIELWTSYRFESPYTLSAGIAYTEVNLKGSHDSESLGGALAGGLDNLQLAAVLEWRKSEVTAFLLTGRYLVLQRASTDGSFTVHPDEFTTIEFTGAATSNDLDFKAAFSLVPAVQWSWKTFNLRLGLGYGNYNIPQINFTLGKKTPIIDLDMYWLF